MVEKGKKIDSLISQALALEQEDAKEAGALGYMCRSLVQATLPHKAVTGTMFSRTNGDFTLSLAALNAQYGLPYGSVPRLLVAWLSTEAVKTKERQIVLGDSLAEFMENIGLQRTGGARGDITRLKKQMLALFNCAITCSYMTNDRAAKHPTIEISDQYDLWWEPTDINQTGLFKSTVTLSQRFFDEVTQNPVPVDIRAIKALKRSPMALDIYSWLTYRMFTIRRYTPVSWAALQMQFGAEYARTRDFKDAFLDQLKRVTTVYPNAKVIEMEAGKGIALLPSPPHIKSLR